MIKSGAKGYEPQGHRFCVSGITHDLGVVLEELFWGCTNYLDVLKFQIIRPNSPEKRTTWNRRKHRENFPKNKVSHDDFF